MADPNEKVGLIRAEFEAFGVSDTPDSLTTGADKAYAAPAKLTPTDRVHLLYEKLIEDKQAHVHEIVTLHERVRVLEKTNTSLRKSGNWAAGAEIVTGSLLGLGGLGTAICEKAQPLFWASASLTAVGFMLAAIISIRLFFESHE